MDIQKILTSEVVDLTSLKDFFSSDKDSLIQLIGVYLSDTTPRIETLDESITNIDYDAVRSICHFLKSSLGLMGVSCLNEIAELEKQAQNNEPEEVIKDRLNYVVPICKASLVEYKIILDKLEAL
jgi:HPt (histidine-containing phosphotransfer) domain-containing protein